jgi:hypothetical protein
MADEAQGDPLAFSAANRVSGETLPNGKTGERFDIDLDQYILAIDLIAEGIAT